MFRYNLIFAIKIKQKYLLNLLHMNKKQLTYWLSVIAIGNVSTPINTISNA